MIRQRQCLKRINIDFLFVYLSCCWRVSHQTCLLALLSAFIQFHFSTFTEATSKYNLGHWTFLVNRSKKSFNDTGRPHSIFRKINFWDFFVSFTLYDKRKYFPRFNSGKRQCSSSRRNRNSLDQFSDGIRSKCLLQINERPNAKSVYSTSPALKEISSWTEDFWYTIDASTFRKIARKVKVNALNKYNVAEWK